MSAAERRGRHALLTLILREGRDPGLKALASCLQVSDSAAEKLLATLERKGFLVRDQSSHAIMGAYPLSTSHTPHRVTLKGGSQQGYALCAVDALGVAPAFGAAVITNATCPHCGRPIHVRVEDNQIAAVEPPGVVVWYSLPELLTKRKSNLNLSETH